MRRWARVILRGGAGPPRVATRLYCVLSHPEGSADRSLSGRRADRQPLVLLRLLPATTTNVNAMHVGASALLPVPVGTVRLVKRPLRAPAALLPAAPELPPKPFSGCAHVLCYRRGLLPPVPLLAPEPESSSDALSDRRGRRGLGDRTAASDRHPGERIEAPLSLLTIHVCSPRPRLARPARPGRLGAVRECRAP